MYIKIKILSWIFEFGISFKKRDRTMEYKNAAKELGWFREEIWRTDLSPKYRFAKCTGSKLTENGLGEYMTQMFSDVSTWKELCKEQNINV